MGLYEDLRKLERARTSGDLTAHNAIKALRQRLNMATEISLALIGRDWDQAWAVAGDDLRTDFREVPGQWQQDGSIERCPNCGAVKALSPNSGTDHIEGCNWEPRLEVFASPAEHKYLGVDLRPAREVAVSLAPFDRRDIKQLIAASEGDRDGPNWLAVAELWDHRFIFLSAGCDYTGWD